MRLLAAALALALPLAIAPEVSFFGDVTPKAIVLLLACAIACAITAWQSAAIVALLRTRPGRWFLGLVAASILVTILSTALSPHRELAWYGSNWRRFGAVEQIAVMLLAVSFAAASVRDRSIATWFLRAACVSGIAASLYASFQYFGLDPFFPAAAYHAGEGPFRIVRPPATLGHADYLGAFLLWPVFAGFALMLSDRARVWRTVGIASVLSSSAGILLSGSRAPLFGLIFGLAPLALFVRPKPRRVAAFVALQVALVAIFYVSPAGERLRARIHWIGEEPAGGARILLWRDSLSVIAAEPLRGAGPENFIAEFPRYQSIDLARAYPDFYHESPHNFVLDAGVSLGIPGAVLLLGLCLITIGTGYRMRASAPVLAGTLTSAVVASVVAHQFTVFTVPDALFFYSVIGLLVAAAEPVRSEGPVLFWRIPAFAISLCVAAILVLAAYRIGRPDHDLAAVRTAMNRNDYRAAGLLYQALGTNRTAGSADLYFSRRWAAAAAAAPDALSKFYYSRLANLASARALHDPEQRPNAFYNLAAFAATRGDFRGTENALRGAIAAAPNWFKPHWALARLLDRTGRIDEARTEAARAVQLDAGKNPEVSETARTIGATSTLR